MSEEKSRSRQLTFLLSRMYDQCGKNIIATLDDVQRLLEIDKGRGYDAGLVTEPAMIIAQVKAAWEPSGLQTVIDNLDNQLLLVVGRRWKDGVANKLIHAPMTEQRMIVCMPPEWHIHVSKVPVNTAPWQKRS